MAKTRSGVFSSASRRRRGSRGRSSRYAPAKSNGAPGGFSRPRATDLDVVHDGPLAAPFHAAPTSASRGALLMDENESVRVVVRVRPLSRKEQQDGHVIATIADESSGTITCSNPKADLSDPPKSFTFDAVFSVDCKQKSIYDKCGATVVEAVLDGYNGTIFAYGQTGAGKTFTMEGMADPPELRGIIPNAFQHIFDKVAVAEERQQFLVRASYLEIYNEEIRDLLFLQCLRGHMLPFVLV